jgi:MoaA/NifB/PqqE/SkfB family radical SAM enzyme
MPTVPKFRIDAQVHGDLMVAPSKTPQPPMAKGLTLPEPEFPQHPEKLSDPGPEVPPEKRDWTLSQVYRAMRGWLFPYVRSRVLPGEFHPMIAYLLVEYKCNLDCWYCWAFNNKIKGMTEDTARQAIDWLYENGCRVLALMGGETLLRPQLAHKVVNYAAKKGFWIYIATNARLLRPEVADRLGDAGAAVFNVAVDAWDEKPGLPKALVPIEHHLAHLLRKQQVYGYMVFLNINICRNNLEDVKQLTEYAHDHRIATDYHLNETPMLEQDGHFRHLLDNPTYIRPEDWKKVDELIDWIIAKREAGYRMVNSVARLAEMKGFMRMAGNSNDLKMLGWYGDGDAEDEPGLCQISSMPGIVQEPDGEIHFADWKCRAGQSNVVVRTDGTLAPCFPMYPSPFNWGNLDCAKFDQQQLAEMKKQCQRHCFSTLNHNLAYYYDDAWVIRFVWNQIVHEVLKLGTSTCPTEKGTVRCSNPA